MNKQSIKRLLKNILQWLLIVVIAIVLAVALRVFVFAKFTIPTPSMEPAIIAGDRVLVSKLTPGPRIITNFFSLRNGEKPVIKRLSGFDVKRNDILVFNFPYSDWNRLDMDMSVFYAKRCVAIPGDTFYIENGFYKVKNAIDTLGCYKNQQQLSETQDSKFQSNIYDCFPFDAHYSWNVKDFGPLYVPRANETLAIDTLNAVLYRKLIEYETERNVYVKDGQVLLGDSAIANYTFTRNYYFMTGDYVFDSQDSRYWGLLPEDHIVGKVAFMLNNENPHTKKVSWKRFLKKAK